jgi:uncharacterized protein YjgD (DUF1641 family)
MKMKKLRHVKNFNEATENLNISDVSDSFLETPYTVGDLKKFINNLPDDMSVTLMSEEDNEPKFSYIKVMDTNKLGIKHPITGEDYDTLVIGF